MSQKINKLLLLLLILDKSNTFSEPFSIKMCLQRNVYKSNLIYLRNSCKLICWISFPFILITWQTTIMTYYYAGLWNELKIYYQFNLVVCISTCIKQRGYIYFITNYIIKTHHILVYYLTKIRFGNFYTEQNIHLYSTTLWLICLEFATTNIAHYLYILRSQVEIKPHIN